MSFNPIFGTGWEYGSKEMVLASQRAYVAISGHAHTGNYSLITQDPFGNDAWIDFSVGGSQSELYIAAWIDPDNAYNQNQKLGIFINTSDSNVSIRLHNDRWDAWVGGGLPSGGTEVATGSINIDNEWIHLQIYVRISNTGQIITKVNGTEDINYEGDTLTGSDNVISEIRYISNDDGGETYLDDFVFGDDGWPGDLRADPIESVGDTATEEWDLSAGADSWDLLDEVPPSDADYIYSTVNGEQTIVELDAWDATDKTPEFVMLWARAKKDVAAAHQIKIIDDDGSNTNVGDAQDLETDYTYVHKLLVSAPDGFQWNDTKVDTLNLGVESVVV